MNSFDQIDRMMKEARQAWTDAQDNEDDEGGGLGVREPRNPHRPFQDGGIALEQPTHHLMCV